jgi:response regulator NasT
MRRFEQFEALRREASDVRQALEDRKIIERAKGLLMKELGLSEAEAFRRLQKTASAKNLKLIDVAQLALTTAKPLQKP